MTHYEIKYDGDVNNPATRKAAIGDIREYLGDKSWNILMGAVEKGVNPREIDMMLHFCGVRGFPIFAFIKEYMPDEYDAWYELLDD
jgi:hypothetical protein